MLRSAFISAIAILAATFAGASDDQHKYRTMTDLLDVCLAAAQSGQDLSDVEIIERSGVLESTDTKKQPRDVSFSLEKVGHFGCFIWLGADSTSPTDFRLAMENYVAHSNGPTGGQSCVWRPDFPLNTCTLRKEKMAHANGWIYYMQVAFHIVAHEGVAITLAPELAFDPDGYSHTFN